MPAPHAFGQSTSLVARLSEILHDYPDSSILKEMLQNADDAGATVLKIGFDKRVYPSSGIPEKFNAEGMQGPALLVYNDSTFTDDDLRSIQSIGQSVKKDNFTKTGRFGIGFNSVYHITETPSFVSGSSVCFFDPSCDHLPGRGVGYRMDLSDPNVAAQVKSHPSLLQPYSRFGCRAVEAKPYNGTLFRLPLRTPEQAKVSDLRKVPCLPDNVDAIFSNFCDEAPEMLLFLKNVLRLELHVFKAGNMEDESATFSTCLPRLSPADAANRAFQRRLPAPPTVDQLLKVSMNVRLDVETGGTSQPWLVRQSTGGGTACRMSCDPMASKYGIKLLAWGGVAAPASGKLQGKAFCFLPMPVTTGLPVHINGYFELPSDRRGIFWGVNDTGEAKFRSDWNHALLTDVIAQEYTRLLTDVQRSVAETPENRSQLYDLLPPPSLATPWSLVSDAVASNLRRIPCLWCGESDGWRRPDDCWVASTLPPAVLSGLRHAGFVIAELPPPAAACLGDAARSLTAEAVCTGFPPQPQQVKTTPDEACAVLDWLLNEISALNGHRVPAPTHPLAAPLRQLPLAAVLSGTSVPFASSALLHCGAGAAAASISQLFSGRPAAAARILSPAAAAPFPSLQEKLQQPQWRSLLGVEQATRCSLLRLLPLAGLPQACTPQPQQQQTCFPPPDGGSAATREEGAAHTAWAQLLWRCLAELPPGGDAAEAAGGGPNGWASAAEGWCVVPCGGGGYTCRLQRQSSDTVRVISGGSPAAIDAVLAEVGVHTADVPPLEGYIEHRTPHGCLRALHAKRGTPLGDASASAVRAWLAQSLYDLPQAEIRRAPQLPVWLVWGAASPAPLPPGHCVLPGAVRGTPVEQLLRHHANATAEEAQVLLRAGIPELREPEFWLWFLREHAGEEQEGGAAGRSPAFSGAAAQALRAAAALQHAALQQAVCDARIVPTEAGGLSAISSPLFDPATRDTAAMVPKARLVEAAFATGEARGALLSLGMHTALSKDVVVDLCRGLAEEGDVERASAMLEYVDRNLRSLEETLLGGLWKRINSSGPTLVQQLREIPWVPAMRDAPHPLLPMQAGPPLRLAADVRPPSQLWLCSASKGIATVQCGTALCERFGWDAPLPPAVLVAQLLAVSREAAARAGEAEADTAAVLNSKVLEIYSALDAHRKEGGLPGALLEGLEGHACIWVGSAFARPHQVAERAASHDLPGLHTLPATLRQFAPLLRLMGMQRQFSPNSYADALGELARVAAGAPLSEAMLQTVGSLLIHLETDASHLTSQVLLPSEAGVLCPPSDLLYDDMKEWDAAAHDDLQGRAVVHYLVSHKVADKFGVLSRRMLIASDGVQDWDLGDCAVAYGQSESITSRIRTILSEYVADVGIFNELLQNADDSRASEFTVMLDTVSYGTKSVLGGAMEAWQGPAIVVHNDSRFSDADFNNLASVGKGAKLQSTSKTGRFGLGFNAVYNFTDVPSILSGGSLVFLDPHRTHLKGTTEGAPGLKMKVPSRNVFLRFADQFAPYKQPEFGSDLHQPYDGTLFRFPLRTEAVAAQSDISKETYTVEQAEVLLRKFCDTASELLLFLKHVRRVRVLLRRDSGVEEVYCTQLSLDPSHEAQHKRIYNFVAGKSDSKASRDDLKQRLSSTQDSDLPWEVTPVTIATKLRESSGKCTDTTTDWILSSAIGRGETKQLAVEAESGRKLIPWGGVALQRCREADAPVSGRAFAFLPLPQSSGMAWHINGAFELSTNRRNLWFDDFDQRGERSLWNVALMKDPCVPAAVRLLMHLKDKQVVTPAQLYALLPGPAVHGLFAEFSNELYRRLRSFPLLKSMQADGTPGEWVAPSDAFLLDLQEGDPHHASRDVVVKALVLSGKSVAEVPPHMATMLKKHGTASVTPACLRDTLRDLPCLPQGIVPADVAQLLAFAASDLGTAEQGFEQLHGVPLLPVASGDVKRFSEGTDPDDLVFYNVDRGFMSGTPAVRTIIATDNLLRLSKVDVSALARRTNLREVAADHLEILLRRSLAPSLFCTSRVSRTNHEAPDTAVVDAFWKTAKATRANIDGDLLKWPLIQCSKSFVDIASSKTVVLPAARGPRGVHLALCELGIDIVASPIFTLYADRTLVAPASPASVAEAVHALHGTSAASAVSKLSPATRDTLFEYLSTAEDESLEKRHIAVLRSLPLFRVHPHASDSFTHVDDALHLPPEGMRSSITSSAYYCAPTAASRRFMQLLGAATVSHQDFVSALLTPAGPEADAAGSPVEVDPAEMSDAVLAYLGAGGPVDEGFAEKLRSAAWVLAFGGSFRRPSDLLHPRAVPDTTQNNVPSCLIPDVRQAVVLEKLTHLGLHTEMSWRAAALWAAALNAGGISGRDRTLLSALELQLAISELPPSTDPEGFADFAAIPCMPVETSPKEGYPHDPSLVPEGSLMPPIKVQPPERRALCSAVYGIALASRGEPPLWLREQPVPCKALAQQLLKAVASVGPADPQQVVPQIYTEMAGRLRGEQAAEMREELQGILEESIVHVGDAFKRPSEVALCTSPVEAAPYLRDIPDDLLGRWVDGPWEPLVPALGVKRSFGASDYAGCLARIAEDTNGQPLGGDALRTVAAIAAFVSQSEAPRALAHLPNAEGVLRRVSELVYNDMEWSGASNDLVHELIPVEVAELIGVQSRKQRVYLESQRSQKINCPQESLLVSRLKDRSVGYLTRDLLEVAHQLGAMSVSFMLDTACHDSRFVIPDTEQHQGPGVLFCLDDTRVSRRDVERLIGGGETPGGGLALAMCFTASDSVQVMADGHLMIFNPRGISLCFTVAEVREKFVSQLSAFRGHESAGLAVRFSLRTEQSTLGHACDPAAMQQLMHSVAKVVPSMLPLLPSIQQVSLLEQGPPVDPTPEPQPPRAAPEEAAEPDEPEGPAAAGVEGGAAGGVEEAAEAAVVREVDPNALRLVSRAVARFQSAEDPRTAVWRNQDWKNTGLSAFLKTRKDTVRTFCVAVDVFEPTADNESETCSTQRWAVVLIAGVVSAQLHDAVGLSPIGGAAALLSVNQEQPDIKVLRASGRHLKPMPQLHDPPTGLPVQLLSVTARSATLSTKQIHDWNHAITNTTHKAYGVLLQEMCTNKDITMLTPQSCYAFWPDDSEAENISFVKQVYQHVSSNPVFLLGTSYKSAHAARFAYVHDLKADIDEGALQAVSKELPVFNVPKHVARGMCLHSGARNISTLSQRDVCNLFHQSSTAFRKVVAHLKTPQQVISLLEIAAHGMKPHEAARLRQVQLLPVGEGNAKPMIVAFGSGPKVFVGGDDERMLFPHKLAEFVHPDVMKSDTLRPLLLDASVQRELGLQMPTPRLLLQHMGQTPVPPAWRDQPFVSADEAAAVPRDWLESLWKKMLPEDTPAFGAWPLFPLTDGRLISCGDAQCVFLFGEDDDADQQSVPDEDDSPAPIPAQPSPELPLLGTIMRGFEMIASVVAPHDAAKEERPCDPTLLREHVCGLGLPVASPSFTGDTRFQPKGTQAQIVAEKLVKCTQRGMIQWDSCDTSHSDAVLKYFSDNARDFVGISHSDNVRKLPLFTHLMEPEKRFALGNMRVQAAPTTNPFLQGGGNWVARSEDTDPLLRVLSVDMLSEADVWVREVLPPLNDDTPPQERYDKLLCLRDNYERLEEDANLVDYMKRTALFPSCNGTLMCGSAFLNPDIQLVKAVVGDDKARFPEARYSEPLWIAFFEQLGMKNQMDAELFMECAAVVHQGSDTDLDEDAVSRATLLVDKLVSDLEAMLPDEGAPRRAFVERLSHMAIVPRVHPVLRTTRLFTFPQCCIPRDARLVVFSMPQLKQKWVPPVESFPLLSLKSPPSVESVVLSLENATDALLREYPLQSSPTSDFCDAVSHIQAHAGQQLNWMSRKSSTKSRLRGTPCLPLNDTVLAAPQRCFLSGDRSIPPLVHVLPEAYQQHAAALQEVGVRQSPDEEFYREALEGLCTEAESPLSPGELNAVLSIVELMCSRGMQVRHIPDADSVMCLAKKTLYNDAPWLVPRLQEGALSFAHPRLTRSLCERLKLNSLQRVVVEKLNWKPVVVESAEAAALTQRLHSREFVECLLELLRFQLSDVPHAHIVEATLRKYRVQFVETLHTRLGAGNADVTRDAEGCLFFADEETHTLYVARLPSGLDATSAVARCVVKVLRLSQVPPFLAQVLGCPPAGMKDYLCMMHLVNSGDSAGGDRAKLGHALLDMDSSVALHVKRQHVVGECVAWEDEAGVKRYGEVAAVHQTRMEDAPFEYDIRIGVAKKRVSCTHVFVFAGAASRHPPAEGGAAAAEPEGGADDEAEGEEAGRNRILTNMMRQLGIPVDGDMSSLMDTLEDSRRQVLELQNRADQAEKNVERLGREKDDIQKQTECCVCLSAVVNKVLVPCGHVLCDGCQPKVQHCPRCRSRVTSAIDLYL